MGICGTPGSTCIGCGGNTCNCEETGCAWGGGTSLIDSTKLLIHSTLFASCWRSNERVKS